MTKNILIFSDGTGQFGGLHPDQRLSNVYKMYRAMRPGPSSPIKPSDQVCFYDAGLGAGETSGFTLRRIRRFLSSAFGTGIDENVIDCYEKIISYYDSGDRILLFGFSRGAYTVRAVANVLRLCGIPTKMPDGTNLPRHGDQLRKIASDAVIYAYNHGNGRRREQEPFYQHREELGRRFRQKYASFIPGAKNDVKGNVQPTFIGVFDTVAALGNPIQGCVKWVPLVVVVATVYSLIYCTSWHWLWWSPLIVLAACWYFKFKWSQFKYYSPDEKKPLKPTNIRDWPKILKHGHIAVWKGQNYDKWLDSEVCFARHALAIDEQRKSFPRVKWGLTSEEEKTKGRQPEWLKQVWFAGCHSDIGGSYLEPESRLSDIALDWMVSELGDCVPDVQINKEMLVRSPGPKAMQHEETYFINWVLIKIPWPFKKRKINPDFPLHPSVVIRLKADVVSHSGEMKQYRPEPLKVHKDAKAYFSKDL